MEREPPVPGLSTEPGARSATSDSAGEWREKDGGGRAGGRAGTGGGTGRHSGGDGVARLRAGIAPPPAVRSWGSLRPAPPCAAARGVQQPGCVPWPPLRSVAETRRPFC